MSGNSSPSLNLNNFEDEVSQRTPYILTSPTSLAACTFLSIKPKELVYRNLEEYEETFSDKSLSLIYKLYEDDETERQEKLIKCRELREKMLAEKKVEKIKEKRNERKKFARSATTVQFEEESSDTESNDGKMNNDDPRDEIIYSTRSVPDLREENLNFDKLLYSPRVYCPSHTIEKLNDDRIYNNYFKRYSSLLNASDLSLEDRKILERLILKKGRNLEWEKKSHEIRQAIEDEKKQRNHKNQLAVQKWHERLANKREEENRENTRRYLEMHDKWQKHRSALLTYFQTRDGRINKYMNELNYQKRKHLVERQKVEAIRQLEMGKAIEKLIEEDRLHREQIHEKLEKRMLEAEVRKRRKEQDYWRHISEMNRLEDVKRCLKQEALEQKTRVAIQDLRDHIEEKDHRAKMNHMERDRLRQKLVAQGSGSRREAMEKAKSLHAHLLLGLEDWHKKVLTLQMAAQERAESNYYAEMNRRRARVASERVLREERSNELLKKVKENDEKRISLVKALIETKEAKAARCKAEKERRVELSRVRAHHAAEIRQELLNQLDPNTFDKKAARVEFELKFMSKGKVLNNGFQRVPLPPSPFDHSLGRKCSCKGGMRSSGGGVAGTTVSLIPRRCV